jgi:hypothetical protein
MFFLNVELKFWELLFALSASGLIVAGAVFVLARVRRRRNQPAFYVEAGGVALSRGEESLLEAIACADGEKKRNLAALARALSADEIAIYEAARLLKQKELIVEDPDVGSGSPRYELSAAGNSAALARNYIKLM